VYPTEEPSREVHVTGRRILAFIIDGIVASLMYFVVVAATGRLGHAPRWDLGFFNGQRILSTLLLGLYYLMFEGLLGATPGKLVAGIRVVQEETGAVPGLGRAFLRTLLRLVDGLGGYLVGFIVVLVSRKRQRLGDMVARTLVVRA
jgi:uncharacterized RDD family membrane protein YckC